MAFDPKWKPLTSYSTLVCVCHGDLHVENLLCVGGSEGRLPRLVVIDFDRVVEGHVCRDMARLEASLLLEAHSWNPDEASQLLDWFAHGLRNGVFDPAPLETDRSPVAKITAGVAALRRLVGGCGQQHWPIEDEEYLLALIAGLLPVARYERGLVARSPVNRALALGLASLGATALTSRWAV